MIFMAIKRNNGKLNANAQVPIYQGILALRPCVKNMIGDYGLNEK